MGSIRGRGDKRWEVVVAAGPDPRRPGRYRQISRTVQGGKMDARRVMAQLEAEVAKGHQHSTTATVNDILDRLLPELERLGRSPATLHGYRQKIEHDIRPAIGKVRLSKLRPGTLNDFYGTLAARGLKAPTIRQIHAIVSSALSEAVRLEWIASNPAKKARPPSAPETKAVAPTPAEMALLLNEAEARSPEMSRLMFVGATTGARRGELCALREPDVDWERARLQIARSVVDVQGQPLTEKDTKNHKTRMVALDALTIDVLRVQRDAMRARAEKAGVGLQMDPFLWSDELDCSVPLRPYAVTYFFRRLRDDLGLKHLTFHRGRHFMVTQALDAGIGIPTVAARAGHDPSLMMRVYAGALEDADRRAADAVSRQVTPGGRSDR